MLSFSLFADSWNSRLPGSRRSFKRTARLARAPRFTIRCKHLRCATNVYVLLDAPNIQVQCVEHSGVTAAYVFFPGAGCSTFLQDYWAWRIAYTAIYACRDLTSKGSKYTLLVL